MAITSVLIEALQLWTSSEYRATQAMALALEASTPYEAVTVGMEARPPVFVRSQVEPKVIPLRVLLLGGYSTRQASHDALKAALGPGLHPLRWVSGATTYELLVSAGVLVPGPWLHMTAAELTAWNPVPTVIP